MAKIKKKAIVKDIGDGNGEKQYQDQPKQPTMGETAWVDPTRLWRSVANNFIVYNPSELVTRKGLAVFDKMRKDDQVKAAMSFKKHAAICTGWEVVSPEDKPKDWEITEFIWEIMDNMEDSVEDTLLGVLTALDYGFSCSEKIYVEDNGKVTIKKIKDCKPHSFEFNTDEHGNLKQLLQYQNGKTVPLDPDKFVIMTYQKEFGNWYGQSDLEAAYRPWWAKHNAYTWLAMFLERLGIPPVFALYDPNAYTQTQKNDLKDIMINMQVATFGIMPRPTRPDAKGQEILDFWTPELAGQTRNVFIPAIDMFNRDIARSVLMPGLLGFTPDTAEGSFARAEKHFDVFLLILEYLRKTLEQQIMMEQVVKPLVEINFGDTDGYYPLFRFLPMTDQTRTDLLDRWIVAVEKGVVVPQSDDEVHIRTMLKFPEKQEQEELSPLPGEEESLPEEEGGELEDELPSIEEEQQIGMSDSDRQLYLYTNFKEIENQLNNLEQTTSDRLKEVLTWSRDGMLKFVQSNFDTKQKWLNDLKLKYWSDLQDVLREFLRKGFDNGYKTMKEEVKRTKKQEKFQAPTPMFAPTEALRWLNQKAFTISGILKDQLLRDAKAILMSAIETGELQGETMKKLHDVFEPYLGDPKVIRDEKQIEPYRLETIVRTNATSAYNMGRLVQARELGDEWVEAVRFSAILDDRTTEQCRLLDGKLFRLSDPVLDRITPPLQFNCRSILVAVIVGTVIDESEFATGADIGEALDLIPPGFGGR